MDWPYIVFLLTLSNLLLTIPWVGKLESYKTEIYWGRSANTWPTLRRKKRSSLTAPSSSEPPSLCISQLESPHGCQAGMFTFPSVRPGAWQLAVTGVQDVSPPQGLRKKKPPSPSSSPIATQLEVPPNNATRVSPLPPVSSKPSPQASSKLHPPRALPLVPGFVLALDGLMVLRPLYLGFTILPAGRGPEC